MQKKELTIEDAKQFMAKYPNIIKLMNQLRENRKRQDELFKQLMKALIKRAKDCKELLDRSPG